MRLLFQTFIFITLLLLMPGACPAENATAENMLSLSDGIVYMYVNGKPIRSKDLIDPIIDRQYPEQRRAIIERYAVQAELRARGIDVDDYDIQRGIDALGAIYQHENKLPFQPNAEQLAKLYNQSPDTLRETARLMMGVLKLLRMEGRLPHDADITSRSTLDAYTKRARELMSLARVNDKRDALPSGVGLEISGLTLTRRELAVAVLKSLSTGKAVRALQAASTSRGLHIIFESELKKRGLTITEAVKKNVFAKLLARIEDKQHLDAGKGMEIFKKYLSDSHQTLTEYMASDDFFKTCVIQLLIDAEGQPDEKKLRAFFNKYPEKFGAGDPLLESIFIEVSDRNGQPFYSFKTGIAAVDRFYSLTRKLAFNAMLQRARAAAALAHTQFSRAVAEFSDDPVTRAANGELGYVGVGDKPKPPFTEEIYRYAREKLKDGVISDPVKCMYGYHILRVTAHRKPTFETSRRMVRVAWWDYRRDQIQKRLWRQADFRGFLAPAILKKPVDSGIGDAN